MRFHGIAIYVPDARMRSMMPPRSTTPAGKRLDLIHGSPDDTTDRASGLAGSAGTGTQTMPIGICYPIPPARGG
jgi:hypothetical protein